MTCLSSDVSCHASIESIWKWIDWQTDAQELTEHCEEEEMLVIDQEAFLEWEWLWAMIAHSNQYKSKHDKLD